MVIGNLLCIEVPVLGQQRERICVRVCRFCFNDFQNGSLEYSYSYGVAFSLYIVAVEHVLPLKTAMSSMGFDPRTCRIVSHDSTNYAKGNLQ